MFHLRINNNKKISYGKIKINKLFKDKDNNANGKMRSVYGRHNKTQNKLMIILLQDLSTSRSFNKLVEL